MIWPLMLISDVMDFCSCCFDPMRMNSVLSLFILMHKHRICRSFLKKLEGHKDKLPKNYTVFIMDVKALCSSVPQKEGMAVCKKALDNRNNKNIPTETIITLMETVLENNIFSFGDQNYRQCEGTVIGSKLGKNFACMYMGEWEKEPLSHVEPNHIHTSTSTVYLKSISEKELIPYRCSVYNSIFCLYPCS